MVNAAEAQLTSSLYTSSGAPSIIGYRLELMDTFFTAVFTVELAINLYAHWIRPFFSDGWNGFDFIVVSLSLIALGPVAMPINVLRSLRAFRVVRLFGRMGALRDIVAALTAALAPVLNAFFILLIICSICKHGVLQHARCKTACQLRCSQPRAKYLTRRDMLVRDILRLSCIVTLCILNAIMHGIV